MAKSSEAEGPLVLTLDVGTSSVRAMVWDRAGSWVSGWETEIEHTMTTTADGGVETDPSALFKRTLKCIDGVLALAGKQASSIAAVGISTFWHSLMGVDADGVPQTPLYTWADRRSLRASEELKQTLDEQAVHRRTGCMLHTSYLPAKLLWLAEEHREAFQKSRFWMSFGEYLFTQLFDRTEVSLSMASGTGLFDQDSSTWDQQLLDVLPITAGQLSPLVDAGTPLIGLKKKWGRRWPALKNVAWYPALGDGACSNVGSNCTTEQRMALMIGTSGALRVLWKANGVPPPAGLWRYRLDAEHILIGGALSNGGNLLRWLKATLKIGKRKEVLAQLEGLTPDGHGLTVLPFLAGERNPDYRADARAAIVGLSLDTKPIEIAQACLESISYRFAVLYDLLSRVAPAAEEIIVNGGAILHRPIWMQITADVLARPLVASSEAEATSRGAALMALRALGELPSIEAAPDSLAERMEPDGERHARYQRGLARHRALYDLLLNQPQAAGSGPDLPQPASTTGAGAEPAHGTTPHRERVRVAGRAAGANESGNGGSTPSAASRSAGKQEQSQ